MEYIIDNIEERKKIRSEIKDLWNHAHDFIKSERFRNMNMKEKRMLMKIEDQLWKLYKLYYNDVLQPKGNTT